MILFAVPLPGRDERRARGALRGTLSRRDHALFTAPGPRPEQVLSALRAGTDGCMTHLIPLRFGRMVASPFAFFRGRRHSWRPIWRARR